MSTHEMKAKGIEEVTMDIINETTVLFRHPVRQTTIYKTVSRKKALETVQEMRKAGINVIL
ncbi:hypothetical protein A3E89_00640 [Candidatus Campbellbacteria bacterium RIFCSPHIGHO2_12_FULL_35_10]|uniref:Uncharacterized protein n=1 Tax=Candidatus Campbellbacteria bacterium RIFCSPHIGHO2_12_FULL_35_10 TaxID=1797578 RepID=A0A1F5ENF0_9BACT|nr:MAG: hypothetical protein A3E89_00640 [Candidatus Campbellbacteria bacterium RIFCSPHIGHO2_12_FULL_35_10]